MRFISVLAFFLEVQFAIASSDSNANAISGRAVIHEMNLARTNPAQYATFIEELRTHFRGNILVLPGRRVLRTKEGVSALNEAISFLRRAQPQAPLAISPGMCRAAAAHCADQTNGRMGHGGSDSSNPGDRIDRYGRWGSTWGENISYGKSSARDTVLALIIDDGLRGRKHRKNIFNPAFSVTGAAYGSHARIAPCAASNLRGALPNVVNAAKHSSPAIRRL